MRFFLKTGNYQKIREYLFEVSAMEEILHEFPSSMTKKMKSWRYFFPKIWLIKLQKVQKVELKY